MIKVSHLIFFIFSIVILKGQGVPEVIETIPVDYRAQLNVDFRELRDEEYKSN